MDRNSELLLAKAGQAANWEDEEKATNDVAQLAEEFRRRLYAHEETEAPPDDRHGTSPPASR